MQIHKVVVKNSDNLKKYANFKTLFVAIFKCPKVQSPLTISLVIFFFLLTHKRKHREKTLIIACSVYNLFVCHFLYGGQVVCITSSYIYNIVEGFFLLSNTPQFVYLGWFPVERFSILIDYNPNIVDSLQ